MRWMHHRRWEMRIRLLNNGTGVILTRQAKIVEDDITFTFESAHEGSTAIFESKGNSYYRELNDGKCVLPFRALDGEISVTVFIKGNSKAIWRCECFKAECLPDGNVILMPNDGDIPGEMARIRVENHDLREKNVELESRCERVVGALEKQSREITVLKKAISELYALIKKNNQM